MTPAAIATLTAECKAEGKPMDLIAKFGNDFSGLDLTGVDFCGAHAVRLETNLRKANFSRAKLAKAQFGGTILDGADFSGADLTDAEFVTASLRGASFQKSNLLRTVFRSCDLTGANVSGNDLSTSLLTSSDFKQANLAGCVLANASGEYQTGSFEGADLSGADLHGLDLERADFRGANLRSANLREANLEEADLTGADLQDADLTHVKVHAAIFDSVRGLSAQEVAEFQRQTRRWEFVLHEGIQHFLDTPLFPLALLLVIPLAALGTGWLRQRQSVLTPERQQPVRQYSISSLLFAMFVIALFLGTALWSATGLYSLTMVIAFYLMVGEITFSRHSRRHAIAPLAVGLSYAALNLVTFACALATSSSVTSLMSLAIFTTFLLPLATFAAVLAGYKHHGSPWPGWGLLGLVIWLAGVRFANLWVIVQISASV
jgi:uncharacterized protein YjbI with pentapeptide repeats